MDHKGMPQVAQWGYFDRECVQYINNTDRMIQEEIIPTYSYPICWCK